VAGRITTSSTTTTTTTTLAGRITAPISYRQGLMRLDPSPRVTPSISAVEALDAAGFAGDSGGSPSLLFGRLTVDDYLRGNTRIINRRLVWLVLIGHARAQCRGPKKACLRIDGFGTRAIPVDARTGDVLGDWFWSGGDG
jgi:hypothetical protein